MSISWTKTLDQGICLHTNEIVTYYLSILPMVLINIAWLNRGTWGCVHQIVEDPPLGLLKERANFVT